jgi:hypothetical protein
VSYCDHESPEWEPGFDPGPDGEAPDAECVDCSAPCDDSAWGDPRCFDCQDDWDEAGADIAAEASAERAYFCPPEPRSLPDDVRYYEFG